MHYSSMAMTDSELSSDHFTPWSASPYHLEQQENQKKHGNKKKQFLVTLGLASPIPKTSSTCFFLFFFFSVFSMEPSPESLQTFDYAQYEKMEQCFKLAYFARLFHGRRIPRKMPTNVWGPFERAQNYFNKKALLVYAVFIWKHYTKFRKEL